MGGVLYVGVGGIGIGNYTKYVFFGDGCWLCVCFIFRVTYTGDGMIAEAVVMSGWFVGGFGACNGFRINVIGDLIMFEMGMRKIYW